MTSQRAADWDSQETCIEKNQHPLFFLVEPFLWFCDASSISRILSYVKASDFIVRETDSCFKNVMIGKWFVKKNENFLISS